MTEVGNTGIKLLLHLVTVTVIEFRFLYFVTSYFNITNEV